MNKLMLLTIATFMTISLAFSQTDSVSFNLRHDVYEQPLYVVDGLKLDSASFFKLSFDKKQIKKVVPLKTAKALKKYEKKGQKGVIEIYTKTMIVLNGMELISTKDKWKYLSNLDIEDLNALKLIKSNEAVKLYGQNAKFGVIHVDTN